MPSTIYNEGRVVGFSAYEIYVRHALCEDPTTTPASELEWLSSSIATGSSMLLKIPAETAQEVSGHHIINIPLPADSNLAAANTIIGSLFIGEAEVDADGWATKVTSYGPLIENNATNPTVGDHSADTTIPPTTYISLLSDEYQDMLLNYVKVVDGIVVQPGHWSANDQADQPPHKDFSPDLSKRPFVKIYVSDTITEDFYVLLTGFTLRTVLAGVSGLNGSTDIDTNFHSNGGFLGPAVFPWANKIVFSVPPAYVNYFIDKRYERAIKNKQNSSSPESYQSPIAVKAVPVIDMESTDPADYYTTGEGQAFQIYQELTARPDDWATKYTSYYQRIGSTYSEVEGQTAPDATSPWPAGKYFKLITSSIGLDVIDANTSTGDRVLTVYQRNSLLPPALYATKVDSKGNSALYPVDTVAPGTVKLFENDTEGEAAKNLEDEIPGNRAFIRNDSDYVLRELNKGQNVVPVAEVSTLELEAPLRFEDLTPPFFMVDGSIRPGSSAVATGQPEDLEYAKVTVVTLKRITGKLSSKVEDLCGYEWDAPAFDTGGVWENANKVLINQIASADQSNYYYIVNASSPDDTPYICPVRKSDHVIDITIPYETGIYVNGNRWYPMCTNNSWETEPLRPNSVVLGSATAGINLNDDETLAGVPTPPATSAPAYDEGFGYIVGAEHPTRKARLANVAGQIDNPTAILPADMEDDTPFEDYYASELLFWWFDEDYLESAGVDFYTYSRYPIERFLRTALYTDVGTAQPLDKDNPNISQTLSFCANTATAQHVDVVLEFSLSNNEENSGKPQYLSLPKNLADDATYALGVHTQTGNKETISLSVADKDLNLYNFQGNGGNNIIPGDGNLHWDDLLDALANNKSIEMLRALFPGFGIAMRRKTKIVDGHPVLGWEIINDKPYIGDGVGYTPLIRGTHFEPVGYNGFVGYSSGTWDTSSTNPAPPINVRILPSSITRDYEYDDNGVTTVGQIPEYINISVSIGGSPTLGKAPYFENPANSKAPITARGFYVGDSGNYIPLTSKPGGTNEWETNPAVYTQYYTYNSTYDVYIRIKSGESHPWEGHTYYKRGTAVDGGDTAYEFEQLAEQPPNWETNYTNYYAAPNDSSHVTSNYPSADNPAAPTFSEGTYYEKHEKWNRSPGFRFYHAGDAFSYAGRYSWIFGMQFKDSTVNLVDGTTLDLKSVRKALESGLYGFRSTSTGTSGIWNIATGNKYLDNNSIKFRQFNSVRASWGAYTNMFKGFANRTEYTELESEPANWADEYTSYFTKPNDNYDYYEPVAEGTDPPFELHKYYQKEAQKTADFYYHPEGKPSSSSDKSRDAHIIAATISYADGYNTQFNAYDTVVEAAIAGADPAIDRRDWEGGRLLYANLLNMEVSCVIYLN